MLKDITNFIAKDTIKPSLARVYVHKDGEKTYAVATDSYKLARIDLSGSFIEEYLPIGYYTGPEWKAICKEINKKKANIAGAMDTIALVKMKHEQGRYNDFEYPDYVRIIPALEDQKDFQLSDARYTKDLFIDFLELIPSHYINFTDLKMSQNGYITYYKKDDIEILIARSSK